MAIVNRMSKTSGSSKRASPSPPASSLNAKHTMQANRGKDTAPELLLRGALRRAGLPGYRLHWRRAPGRPDVAFPGRRVAVFVNGCFWHRCPHCSPPVPKANRDFWLRKFSDNQLRDARKSAELEAMGWRVITLWECQLKADPALAAAAVADIVRGHTSGPPT